MPDSTEARTKRIAAVEALADLLAGITDDWRLLDAAGQPGAPMAQTRQPDESLFEFKRLLDALKRRKRLLDLLMVACGLDDEADDERW